MKIEYNSHLKKCKKWPFFQFFICLKPINEKSDINEDQLLSVGGKGWKFN